MPAARRRPKLNPRPCGPARRSETEPVMTNVLLHIGSTLPSAEDVSKFRPLVDALGARLHVIYTQADPLSAGSQTEMGADMPALHQAMEAEAREKLAGV